MMIYVLSVGEFIVIDEGTGDNLLNEDIADGYVDYINYEIYKPVLWQGEPVMDESDGGMVLLTVPYSDLTEDEVIVMTLEVVYGRVLNFRKCEVRS